MYKKIQSTRLIPPKTVLVVDDEKLSRDVLSKILSRYLGCEVFAASGGNEALSYLKAKDFDLIIADLVMPGISGLKLIEAIRLEEPETPILVVTGNAADDEISLIKDIGIKRIIYKPFKISSLLEMVAGILIEKEKVNSYA